MVTYYELLRQPSATCSCCGQSQYPGSALVYTGRGGRVEWVLCHDCEQMCDRLANRVGQVDCSFDVCKQDPRDTRERAAEFEDWKRAHQPHHERP